VPNQAMLTTWAVPHVAEVLNCGSTSFAVGRRHASTAPTNGACFRRPQKLVDELDINLIAAIAERGAEAVYDSAALSRPQLAGTTEPV